MNILFVCHRFPFPPNRGGKIRPFHMIRHLAQKHFVAVASLAHTDQELQEGLGLKSYCQEVIAEVLPTSVRWVQASRAVPTRRPSSVTYFWSPQLYRRVQELCRRIQFDIVFVHCAFAAQYVIDLRAGFRVLDFGDLDSAKWSDYSRHRAWPLRFGYQLESRKLRAYEKELARQFDFCTFTTEGELEEFKALGVPVPCAAIPNGVDAGYYSPRRGRCVDSAVLVFLGRMDYFPNVDGIVHFARNVLPSIRQRVPKAELRIVGTNPTQAVRELARLPGISVTGHVADVRPWLEDAALAVVPLRVARGTQNKILQCLALGIPVVATSQAAKGVQAVPGRDLLVADDSERLAELVVEALQSPELRERLAKAGRRQVETAHDWLVSMKLLDDLIDLSRSAPGGPVQEAGQAGIQSGSRDPARTPA